MISAAHSAAMRIDFQLTPCRRKASMNRTAPLTIKEGVPVGASGSYRPLVRLSRPIPTGRTASGGPWPCGAILRRVSYIPKAAGAQENARTPVVPFAQSHRAALERRP